MSGTDDFLAATLDRLHHAETALRNGDAAPRKAMWSFAWSDLCWPGPDSLEYSVHRIDPREAWAAADFGRRTTPLLDAGALMKSDDRGPNPGPTWRQRSTSFEVAAIAGIVCAVGWSLSLHGLVAGPGLGATHDEIATYYAEGSGRSVTVLLALMVVATIAFLWFVGVVRNRLGASETRLVGTVFLGASVLLTGLLLVGASALAAPSILVDVSGQAPDPGAAALLRALAAVVLAVFAPRVATLVMFSTASLSRRASALPSWLIVVTYVVGVAEFVNVTIATPTLYVFPA